VVLGAKDIRKKVESRKGGKALADIAQPASGLWSRVWVFGFHREIERGSLDLKGGRKYLWKEKGKGALGCRPWGGAQFGQSVGREGLKLSCPFPNNSVGKGG